MKKNVTYVDVDELLNRVAAAGFTITPKKAWYQILGPGGKIYIPIRKSVGRVDVSGFATSGVLELDELEAHGAITQILDQGKENGENAPTVEQVLANFDSLLLQLAATKAPEPKPPKPAREPKPELTDEEKGANAARKEMLKASANKKREERAARAAKVANELPAIEIDDVPEAPEQDEDQTDEDLEMAVDAAEAAAS